MKQIVEGYEQHGYSLKGTSMDQYYMPISLAERLFNKNITWIEMLNSNQKRLPLKSKRPT